MGLSAEELKVGDSYSEVVVEDLTRTQIVQYAGASGDYNPVHSDEKFVTASRIFVTATKILEVRNFILTINCLVL